MTSNIQYVKMPTSEAMSQYVSEKLNKLADKYGWIINADVFFKLENDPAGNGKICEIELSAPGPKLFAQSKENNFELAAKKTVSELEIQLKKRKAILRSH
ncbi:HPF/RaiA family ribosome-associated protein [Salegentibacter chungangensis]|uniref:HPF/RaiA family ribosome-associated protein n=1 Tax=Salegentibacter chungangensis TaxID=1335724 RepID=A0ABW3NMW8_9FLAO